MPSTIGQILIDIVKCEVLGGEAPEPRILKQIVNTESGETAEESGAGEMRKYIDDLIDIAEINGIIQLVANNLISKKSKASAEEGEEPLLDKTSAQFKRLKESYDAELYRALTFGTDLSRIGMILEKEGIDYIPLKGAIIRDLYPKPWMRTSMDMDILVREEDLDRAIEALTSQPGFMKVNENGHHVLIESKTGWIIEIHFDLNAGDKKADKYLKTAWEHAKPFGEVFAGGGSKSTHKYAFDLTFFYTYFIYHLAHHASEYGGCGIRAMLDLYILNQKLGLDFSLKPEKGSGGQASQIVRTPLQIDIESSLKSIERLDFARKMSAIASLWFGDIAMDEIEGLGEEELEEIERFIIIGGTHGTKSSSSLALHYASGDAQLRKKIFLSYESLSRRYRGLRGRRYLTPVYEVKRWASALTSGGAKRASESLENDKNITDEEADRTARIMQNIGLGK